MLTFFKKIVLILLLAATPFICEAQQIKLVHAKSGREISLVPGTRVVYVSEASRSAKVGILKEIYQDSITVDDKILYLKDIRKIGRRKKGSGFGSFILAALGGATIGTVLAPDPDPCPRCQTVSSPGDDGRIYDVVEVGIGAALIGLAVSIGARNSARDVKSGTWQLEIVD